MARQLFSALCPPWSLWGLVVQTQTLVLPTLTNEDPVSIMTRVLAGQKCYRAAPVAGRNWDGTPGFGSMEKEGRTRWHRLSDPTGTPAALSPYTIQAPIPWTTPSKGSLCRKALWTCLTASMPEHGGAKSEQVLAVCSGGEGWHVSVGTGVRASSISTTQGLSAICCRAVIVKNPQSPTGKWL